MCGEDRCLDIKIFSSSDRAVVYLRKFEGKADEPLYEGFASIGAFVDSLNENFNNREYSKCIERINSLLRDNRFVINGNEIKIKN